MFKEFDGKFDAIIVKKRQKFFPLCLSGELECRSISYEEFISFLKKNYRKVFPQNSDYPCFDMNSISRRRLNSFYKLANHHANTHHDYFGFFNHDGEMVGWTSGRAEDAQTYYMISTGIIKKYRGRGLYSEFLSRFSDYISELGYERISSHHHGDNPAVLIPKLRAGFVFVGVEVHEMWGTLFKMVKHLKKDRKKIWERKFN